MRLLWIEQNEHVVGIDQTGHISKVHDSREPAHNIQTYLQPIQGAVWEIVSFRISN